MRPDEAGPWDLWDMLGHFERIGAKRVNGTWRVILCAVGGGQYEAEGKTLWNAEMAAVASALKAGAFNRNNEEGAQ